MIWFPDTHSGKKVFEDISIAKSWSMMFAFYENIKTKFLYLAMISLSNKCIDKVFGLWLHQARSV